MKKDNDEAMEKKVGRWEKGRNDGWKKSQVKLKRIKYK